MVDADSSPPSFWSRWPPDHAFHEALRVDAAEEDCPGGGAAELGRAGCDHGEGRRLWSGCHHWPDPEAPADGVSAISRPRSLGAARRVEAGRGL